MDIGESKNMNDVYTAVGHAVSTLMKSGKTVGTDSILAQLRHFEEQSVDGMRKIYAEAIHMVSSEMN